MNASLDIIIVNWNTGDLLEKCLASIRASHMEKIKLEKIIVVDNASSDSSLECLRTVTDCEVVFNDNNTGFAAACNQAAKLSDAEFILFLNPDVVLEKNSLEVATTYLIQEENQRIGIVGIQLRDETGHIQCSCARFPEPLSMAANITGLDRLLPGIFSTHFLTEWAHDSTREVDQVMGAFFLVRSKLFGLLHGFDERFFVYYEELDFSLRARQHNWKSVFLSATSALHVGGGSSVQVKDRRLFYVLRSRTYYCNKHFGKLIALGLVFLTLLIEPVARVVNALVKRKTMEVKYILVAYLNYLCAVPTLLFTNPEQN